MIGFLNAMAHPEPELMSSEHSMANKPLSSYYFNTGFSYKFSLYVNENQISGRYNVHLSNKDFLVTDSKKVTGYLINGHYFDFKHIY